MLALNPRNSNDRGRACVLCGHVATDAPPSSVQVQAMRALQKLQPEFAEVGKKLAHEFKNPLGAVSALAGGHTYTRVISDIKVCG